jgi:transcriptional regulator with XRE-family HTH domain
MPSATEVERVEAALRDLLRHHGCSLRRASRALGRYRAYLGRTLRGRAPLKVEDVFRLLAFLKVEPYDFFEGSFPLGGEALLRLDRAGRRSFEPDGRDRLADMLRREAALRGEAPRSPRRWTERAAKLLRGHLRQAHLSQHEASRRLGLGPKVLGQGLRGETRLTFEHLFGALSVAGVSPGRFFEELFGPGEEEILPGLTYSGLIGQLEPLTVAACEELAGEPRPGGAAGGGKDGAAAVELRPTELQRDLAKLRRA